MPKPFNLQEALAGKPVVTREGKKVIKIYHLEEIIKKDSENLIVIIKDDWYACFEDGKIFLIRDSNNDLFMADEEKEMCVICEEKPILQKNLCVVCWNISHAEGLVILAKRIKALEEKLK